MKMDTFIFCKFNVPIRDIESVSFPSVCLALHYPLLVGLPTHIIIFVIIIVLILIVGRERVVCLYFILK